MGKFFWPTYIVVASSSCALVWKFAPMLGARLPPEVRRQICEAVDATRTQFTGKGPGGASARQDDTGAHSRVRPVDLTDPDAAWGVLNRITPVEGLDGKPIGNVAGGKFFLIKERISTPKGGCKVIGTFFESKKLTGSVRIPAENLFGFSGQPTDLTDSQRECLGNYYRLTGEAKARKAKVENEALDKDPYQRDAEKTVARLRALVESAKRPNTGDLDEQRKMTYEISQLRTKLQDLQKKRKTWAAQHASERPAPPKDPVYLNLLQKREEYAEPVNDLLLR